MAAEVKKTAASQGRDSDTRKYEVLKKHDHLPAIGTTIECWPWGKSIWTITNPAQPRRMTIDKGEVTKWVDEGYLKLVAPRHLVLQEAKSREEKKVA